MPVCKIVVNQVIHGTDSLAKFLIDLGLPKTIMERLRMCLSGVWILLMSSSVKSETVDIEIMNKTEFPFTKSVSVTTINTSLPIENSTQLPPLITWSSLSEECAHNESNQRCVLRGVLFVFIRGGLLFVVGTTICICVLCINRKYVCKHSYQHMEWYRVSWMDGLKRNTRSQKFKHVSPV